MGRQQIIDAIRDQWIKDYGSLEDGQDRNGYFVIGFVDSVLKGIENGGRNNETDEDSMKILLTTFARFWNRERSDFVEIEDEDIEEFFNPE